MGSSGKLLVALKDMNMCQDIVGTIDELDHCGIDASVGHQQSGYPHFLTVRIYREKNPYTTNTACIPSVLSQY